ncbi:MULTISPECIES: hypothetical protein [unclassified Sphingobacterium]|uniref:hypothetical protein n=1 Tax=unclassified Sphingobacterium TaxID=2609468 RepID=UPI0020C48ED6|nr:MULTISPECIES: hypothetical protein [unclassified Sphingobacterium]
MTEPSLENIFDSLPFNFKTPMRLSYVFTDCFEVERSKYLSQFLSVQTGIVPAPSFVSPRELFEFLKAHHQMSLYFEDEILYKRIEYIRLLEGAICANDLGKPWSVCYNEDSFEFKGKILIASKLSKEELKNSEKLHYILRDSIVI